MSKKLLAVVFSFILIQSAFAQSGAVSSLTLQQSPLLFGAGSIGTAIPQYDASGFYLNPAQLGNFASKNNLSLFIMPEKTKWIPAWYYDEMTYSSFGITAGYNFANSKANIPLSVGVGYIHNKLDYGKSFYNGGYTSFDCFSLGASYESFLIFNFGISIKSYKDVMNNVGEMRKTVELNGMAYDFGLMVTAPLTKLILPGVKLNLSENSFIKPLSSFTLGYALLNIGNEVSYIDPSQSDPISRTGRLGYSFNFGLELNTKLIIINAFSYSFTAEAEDMLISSDENGYEYQNIFGDIKIGKNLIQLKGDNNVIIHKGHIFNIFETLIITSGRFYGRGYNDNKKADGIGFSSEGLFKLLNATIENSTINYITKHFVLEYYDAYTFYDSPMETNLKGLTLTYRGYGL